MTPNNTQNNHEDDFDIEAKREQWKQEREEMRAEENSYCLQKTEKNLRLYTIVIVACFFVIAAINRETIMDNALDYINHGNTLFRYLFLAIWFGVIGDTTRLAIQKHKPLMKFCIAIILCAILSIGAMLVSFIQLPESTANTVFMLGRAFALAGAVCTLYPIKYAWTKPLADNAGYQ